MEPAAAAAEGGCKRSEMSQVLFRFEAFSLCVLLFPSVRPSVRPSIRRTNERTARATFHSFEEDRVVPLASYVIHAPARPSRLASFLPFYLGY